MTHGLTSYRADKSLKSREILKFVCNRVVMSREILMFVRNQVAKSHEILMFVCLQKDAKQCCDATE